MARMARRSAARPDDVRADGCTAALYPERRRRGTAHVLG